MRKWPFLCILFIVVLFSLFVLTNKPISQAESISLVKNYEEISLSDAPSSNAIHYNMNGSALMDKQLVEPMSTHLKENQQFASSPCSNELYPQKNDEPPIVANGLLPLVNYKYTYAPSFEGETEKTYVASNNPYVANAVNLMKEELHGFTYIESENSFSLGIAYSDVFFFSLQYPLKQQTTTVDKDISYESNNDTNVTVESTSMTLTTKAGTFENVVAIRYPNGSTLYLAKGYGVIRITDFNGEITTELIARK